MRAQRLVAVIGATAAIAGPWAGSAAAAPPERAADPFVCPVITPNENAVTNAGRFTSLGNGEYTFGPGAAGDSATFNGNVPNHATNADGTGSPGGDHAAPGDTTYTAIWSGNS
jgi:hypothetical protein